MPMSTFELENIVRQSAALVCQALQAALPRVRSEADLVSETESVLRDFAGRVGLQLEPPQRERTLIKGRADAIYSRLVIEYEPPRSLTKRNDHGANRHAIGQVRQYLGELAQLERQRPERLAGVIFDGQYLIFVRHRQGHWREQQPRPLTPESTETFLRYLLALTLEQPLTPENLVADFGEGSEVACQALPAFYEALGSSQNPKVQTLFRQWCRQFGEVSGYEQGAGLDLRRVARSYSLGAPEVLHAERFFFALHSYYALLIKLLAWQVIHFYLAPNLGSDLGALADLDDHELRGRLAELENGGLFRQLGFKNLLEGDFFGWYLESWSEPLAAAARALISRLAGYAFSTLDVDPAISRDLLKQLYQNLMPRKLRHDLGEYYTPDWLAQRVLAQLGYQGDPSVRLLDPACGSGTFLVLAIALVRAYGEERALPENTVLADILNNIVGYDLNPLAVITARTNYLLALGDLLRHRRGDIDIPIYLCDSVLTPSLASEADGQTSFLPAGGSQVQLGHSFNTAVGRFSVPGVLVHHERIDRFAGLLEDAVKSGNSSAVFERRLLNGFDDLPQEQVRSATALYEQLADLERQGINGIWARIIKNAFAPLFQGRFDLVAGNPPWVNWQSLPGDYRQETKPLWVYAGLFPHSGMDTILGKGKKDISMLMTYVALERYLKREGKLGFVITQSVFKTSGAGQGFRRFRLGDGTPLRVLQVDDLSRLKPFAGASNRTAIVVLQRDLETRYPAPYNRWYRPDGGRSIPEDLTLGELLSDKIARYHEFVGQPVDAADPTSPWITGRRPALAAVEKVLGASDYQAREGANTGGANAVYWLRILQELPDGNLLVENIVQGAKRKVPQVQVALEPELIYPLLRGRDVRRWRAAPQAHILMVQDPAKRRGYDEAWLSATYPKIYAYLVRSEEPLRARRSQSVRNLMESGPFYSMFAIGDYTYAPYKVVWPWISKSLVAAVVSAGIGGRVVVPEHNTSFVGFEDAAMAHFFCACFNSSPAGFAAISSYSGGGGGIASPAIVERIRVPDYDSAHSLHRELAALSQRAHAATAQGEEQEVGDIEAEIDRLAAQLWGLTPQELVDIQKSLREL